MPQYAGTLADWNGMIGYRPSDPTRAARVAATESTYPPGVLDGTAADSDWLEWGERLMQDPPERPTNTQMLAMAKATRTARDMDVRLTRFIDQFDDFLEGLKCPMQ